MELYSLSQKVFSLISLQVKAFMLNMQLFSFLVHKFPPLQCLHYVMEMTVYLLMMFAHNVKALKSIIDKIFKLFGYFSRYKLCHLDVISHNVSVLDKMIIDGHLIVVLYNEMEEYIPTTFN